MTTQITMALESFSLLLLLCFSPFCGALDNGLALTPPMGWRSWNFYEDNILQQNMVETMDALARERTGSTPDERTGALHTTTLRDLGYSRAGLDDNWQGCNQGYDGSFHRKNGYPIINTDRFPDMKAMVDHGHALDLKVGWYMNNCICREWEFILSSKMTARVLQQSVQAIFDYGFDSVKLDGCGQFLDLTDWAREIHTHEARNEGKVLMENCHFGYTVPRTW